MVRNCHAAGDLIYPVGMPATFKISSHEICYHFFRIAFPYKPGRNTNNIGIIMLA